MTEAALAGDQVSIEPGWGQGRATFGGVLGALLVARARGLVRELGDEVPLRTMTAFLLAPVAPGPVELTAQTLRRGKSVTLVQVGMAQTDTVVATAQLAFGASRASTISYHAGRDIEAPAYPPATALPAIDQMPGAPEFLARVALRPAAGAMPFSGAGQPDFGGWMSYREPTPMTVEHFVGLIDAWPPSITPLFATPTPVSTLSWTVDVLTPPAEQDTHFQYRVHTDACLDGYAHSDAHVWSADDRLLAVSRQTVSVFG